MANLFSYHSARVVIATTFVSLLGMPIVGPVLPTLQVELEISTKDIGWIIMSSYTLPALIFLPLTGYLADRFGKKAILVPSLFLFAVSGGLVSLAPNHETLIGLRFAQGIGASALSTLNTAIIPDFFRGTERIRMIGYVGGTQSVGSGILPLLGGVLASITWYLPFTTSLIAIPVGFYVIYYLDDQKHNVNDTKLSYMTYATTHILDVRVLELCFFTFAFIFIGFGTFISYVPTFMNNQFGSAPILIGLVIASRALTGAISSTMLSKLTTIFSSRTLTIFSFSLLSAGMASLPLLNNQWQVVFAGLCYGAAFGIIRPLIQVHLFEISPHDLRSTFSSANGLALRIAQTISPFVAGLIASSYGFDTLYISAACFAMAIAVIAFFAQSLKRELN